jgi:hypothetical protein
VSGKAGKARSPDRQASIARRRHLAASGPMPPALAARFTQAEMAAFRIVSDEVRHHGVCALHIDAIAARAGTCRTTVKNALREARRLNLVTVQERRRRGQRSLTNIIHIISREWRDWLQHERQKRRQAEFVTDEEQRLLEIEDMRLVVKFGEKRRYSDREREAIYEAGLDDEAIRDPDAIEAVYRKLNAADEAEAARRALGGPSTVP